MGTLAVEIRREVKARGLDCESVQAAYAEVKLAEREKRERSNEVRESAWIMATSGTPKCWGFWRHGFASRWGAKVDRHDYTVVPGYDEIAQQIASLFPEYDHADGTEDLFAFLLSPYDKLPGSERLYRMAMDLVELTQKTTRAAKTAYFDEAAF